MRIYTIRVSALENTRVDEGFLVAELKNRGVDAPLTSPAL